MHRSESGSASRGADVVIIGSGPGGSTLAYRLAQRGVSVLVVERGDYLRLPAHTSGEPIGKFIGDFHPAPQVVGGPTKFYGAALYRFRESDFRATRHESGESPAWPITYADLEPFYTEAERLYGVRGSSEGDPSEPPRAAPYPHPPLPHAEHVGKLVDRLRRSGTQVSSIPRGLDYGPGGACVLCPTCDAYYCRLDAKYDAETAALRPALKTGRVELLTNTECLSILTDDSGTRATGIVVRRHGVDSTIEAGIVAVSSGIPESARLLLTSVSPRHPRGLGNGSGCVGRYGAAHTTGMILPIISLAALPPMHTKTFAINAYYDASPDWPHPTGVIQAAGQMPFWGNLPRWQRPAAKLLANRSLYCFYMTEALPSKTSGYEFDGPGEPRAIPPIENTKTFERMRRLAVDAFRRAGYRSISPGVKMLFHGVGTVRFGSDPATSVLDPECRVHGVENVFVVDASVFPSAGAVNNSLTIAALALRAGDSIARQLSVRGVATSSTPVTGIR